MAKDVIDAILDAKRNGWKPNPRKPGPLERLERRGLKKHCQMCGNNDAPGQLEPAFNPDGKPMTLCRLCRIGSAELLADRRAKKPYVLVTVSGGVADVVQGSSVVDVDILDYDNLRDCGPGDIQLSDGEWAYLEKHSPELFEFFAPSFAKKDE
jgi:hypothetical protein